MKKITTFLIVMIISCSCLQVSANNDVLEAKKANFNIVLHGRQEKFNLPIATINDNTYVPLRELCEKLNMNLYWDAHDKEISPYKPNTERTAYTLKDFSFLTIDMSINDIMERMGEPSYWDGSGAPWAVYVLSDGSELSLAMYRYNIETRKKSENPGVVLDINGTDVIINFNGEGTINIY